MLMFKNQKQIKFFFATLTTVCLLIAFGVMFNSAKADSEQQGGNTVDTMCVIPDSLGDTTTEVIGTSSEPTVADIVSVAGLTIGGQTQYQIWHTNANKASTTIEIEMLNGYTAAGDVFGYYQKGQSATFVPLFIVGHMSNPVYSNIATGTPGQKYTVTVPGDISFAVNSQFDANRFWAGENSLNAGGEDHMISYDVISPVSSPNYGSYVLGFEDIPLASADKDYNDIVVKFTIKGCMDINPPNTPPVITLLGDATTTIMVGQNFVDPGATALDQEDGNITSQIVVSGNVSTSTPGTYVLTYNVTDSQGLAATPVTRTVIVQALTPSQPLVIDAIKIVCDKESDLPNWGLGGPDITASTSGQFLASHPNCHLRPNWNFQWGYGNVTDPGGSFIGEAQNGWTTFGPTNQNGTASTSISISNTQNSDKIWMREVLKNGYIPFTYPEDKSNNPVSAEMYCHTDVLNYDNYDSISNPSLGNTYYCVAFNALISTSTPPVNNTPPVITLTGSSTVNILVGQTFNDPGATALDQEDGNITSQIVVSGNVSTSTPGTYVLTYNVTDSQGLAATPVTRTVVVNSLPQCLPPQITSSLTASATVGQSFTYTLTASSTATTTLSVATSTLPSWLSFATTTSVISGTPTQTGTFNITLEAIDSCGADTKTLVLTVNSAPTPPGGGGGGGGGMAVPPVVENPPLTVAATTTATTTPPTASAPAECNYLLEYLKIGQDNNPVEVRKLQTFLRDYEGFNNLAVSGIFDQATFDAVASFQEKYGADVLSPWGLDSHTGYVYITTKKKVNEIYCQRSFPLTTDQTQEIEAYRNSLEQLRQGPATTTLPEVGQKIEQEEIGVTATNTILTSPISIATSTTSTSALPASSAEAGAGLRGVFSAAAVSLGSWLKSSCFLLSILVFIVAFSLGILWEKYRRDKKKVKMPDIFSYLKQR